MIVIIYLIQIIAHALIILHYHTAGINYVTILYSILLEVNITNNISNHRIQTLFKV